MESTLHGAVRMENKVPEVTAYFWIVKLLAVTVGETAADFISGSLGLGLTGTSAIMGAALVVALVLHMRSRRYVPWLYWVTVVLLSIVGTLITDNLSDNLGVPLHATTVVFAVALLAVFTAWYAVEKTLSIRTIYTTRREAFYWAAILLTFALGTAGGDFAAEALGLGYATSGMIFAAFIAVVALAYYAFDANAVLAFWIVYVATRPLGASFGDWLSQAAAAGGLGLGPVITSAVFLGAIVALVSYLTITRRDALGAPVARPLSS